jgi:hypothetical protein
MHGKTTIKKEGKVCSNGGKTEVFGEGACPDANLNATDPT